MMDFYEVLDQAVNLLRNRGRVTYRALQRQFELDDAVLEDLKNEMLFAHPEATDEGGHGLRWAGDLTAAAGTEIVSSPTSASTAPEKPEPRAYTPQHLAEKILTSRSALEGERKQVMYRGLTHLQSAEFLYETSLFPERIYTFKHALTQNVAYQSLLTSTRQQYHEQIVQVLAEQFPDLSEIQPELLAHHYTEAGLAEQVVGSWYKAGHRAIERSANVEAVSHLTTGLSLLETLPGTAERTELELAMLTQLGPALMATRGVAAVEAENTYTRARELCQQVGDVPRLFAILRGLWNVYLVRAEMQKAYDLAEQLLPLTQNMQDVSFVVEAHWVLGTTLFFLGKFVSALAHLEQGQALRSPHKQRSSRVLQDPDVGCLVYGARTLWSLGYPDQALTRIYESLSLARHMTHPYSIVWCHIFAALIHQKRREWQAAQEQAETAYTGASEHGFELWRAGGTICIGRGLVVQGKVESGIVLIQQGLRDWQATGASTVLGSHEISLAEAYGIAGEVDAGLRVLDDALGRANNTAVGSMEAEFHRLKGQLLLQQSTDNATEAESCFHQAIDIARSQQAKSWELRTATSLARLWQRQGKRQEAYDLLAPVYGWFTEGFDTADLKDAKALLDELGS